MNDKHQNVLVSLLLTLNRFHNLHNSEHIAGYELVNTGWVSFSWILLHRKLSWNFVILLTPARIMQNLRFCHLCHYLTYHAWEAKYKTIPPKTYQPLTKALLFLYSQLRSIFLEFIPKISPHPVKWCSGGFFSTKTLLKKDQRWPWITSFWYFY